MMRTMGVRELKARMSEALREVQEGQTIEVTNHGQVVALLVPPRRKLNNEEIEAALDSIDSLAAQISAHWPEGVTAREAIQDVRRDL
jgi:prevent-host-death family protein